MLLGYIFDVVKDEQQAEKYLIDVFNDVPAVLHEFSEHGTNAYCKLQLMAKKRLSGYFKTVEDCEDGRPRTSARPNKYTDLMTAEQQLVFCGIHYQGKNTATIAAELNTNEEGVRRLLKEAFIIIRNNRDHAGIH